MRFPQSSHPVVVAARRWIGTPFQHQGRLRGEGVDCIGLIIGVAHELGISQHDCRNYAVLPDCHLLVTQLDAHMDRLPAREAREGDVLLIAWRDDPLHTGIFTGRTIIHALQSIGRVSEHRLPRVWQNKIVSAYRYRGIAWPSYS